MDIRYWKLFGKYVTDEISEEEKDELEAWVSADPARRELLRDVERAWKTIKKDEPPRTDAEAAWNKLKRRIEKEETRSPTPQTAREDRGKRSSRRRSSSVRQRLLRVAGGVAVILVAIFATLLWKGEAEKVVYTERGERSTVELVDGTQVHLNADSRLRISSQFGRDVREVYLEGEAYFNVAHDKQRPFQVHTSEGTVQVVGTAFNVNAYTDEREAKVAVEEGAVALRVEDRKQPASPDTVILKARQFGVLAGQRLRDLRRDVDVKSQVAWKEGRLVFEDAPFREVVRRLERWYDLQIEAPRDDGSIDRLNAVFDQETANEVISDIAVALDLQYEREREKITFYRREDSPSQNNVVR